MIRKAFKVGDTITIKRTSHAGTGYRYALVRLTGGVALVEELSEDADTLGGMSVQSFTFQFLQPGQVEIQFAYYRDVTGVLYEDVFPYTVVNSEKADIIIGGWGEFEPLTDQDKELFQTCMTLKGVDYTPLLVAKQLVSGYNYRFICMTKTVTREPKYGFAKVTIYAPLKGEPLLESIVEY
ncbi:protease inhibitor I42 family protein [Bacteroides fragilis]|uniref:protease inhibitor I42 family protein n=1 Tax=Bacteroides hominis TaxID=2763023 RepID=UPI002940700B|nr:protease inhibitor I42 family protein [Bacteroides fragilis]